MCIHLYQPAPRARGKASRGALVAAAAVGAALGATSVTRGDIATFTPGDIVVLSGGSQSTDTGTVPATLQEYNPVTGVLDGQLTIPSGATNPLTLAQQNITSHEGVLTRSESGQYLTFAGYASAPGTGLPTAVSNGVVGVVGNSASTLNTSTTFTENGQAVRAATTINGAQFYVGQAHGTAQLPAGLSYISGTGPSATVTNLGGLLDPRSLAILGGANPSTGVLAAGSGSSSFNGFGGTGHGVYGLTASGGGLPTSASISGTQISADASDGSDVFFTSEPGNSASYHGYNTLYIASDTSGGGQFIEKLSYSATTGKFTLVGSTAPTTGQGVAIGITATVDPVTGLEDVFYTEKNGIYELTSPNNSTSAFTSTTSTLFASPGTDAAFYGVADAPVAAPEPAGLSLLAIGAIGLLARRRRA